MVTTRLDQERPIELAHAVFRRLRPVLFRRTEDGRAAMVARLGEGEAVLPLRALRREFGIGEDSRDGRMLALVEQALDYVACVRADEALPPEVAGDAGFEPTREHRRRALSGVRSKRRTDYHDSLRG